MTQNVRQVDNDFAFCCPDFLSFELEINPGREAVIATRC